MFFILILFRMFPFIILFAFRIMGEERYENLCVKNEFRTDKHLVVDNLESWGGTIYAPSLRVQKLTGTDLTVQHPQRYDNQSFSNGTQLIVGPTGTQRISNISGGSRIFIGGNVIRNGNNVTIGSSLISNGSISVSNSNNVTNVYIHQAVNETIKVKGRLVVTGVMQTRHLNVERYFFICYLSSYCFV